MLNCECEVLKENESIVFFIFQSCCCFVFFNQKPKYAPDKSQKFNTSIVCQLPLSISYSLTTSHAGYKLCKIICLDILPHS